MIREQVLNYIEQHGDSREPLQSGFAEDGELANEQIAILRQRLNDENYLHAAIQRLAFIMSKQLMEISKQGGSYEQRRKKRT